MKRRIKAPINITLLSLCKRGKNKLRVLYKADAPEGEANLEIDTLCKFDEDRGEITALVYVPEHRDSEGDIADAKVIRKAAHSHAKNGFGLDLTHDGKELTKEQAFVAESWIVTKGDQRFAGWKDYQGKTIDPTGGWAVLVKIEDENLRQLYRSGDWDGVSMFGFAAVEFEKSETGPQKAADLFKQRSKETDMDETKLAELLKAFGTELSKSIVDALKPEEEKKPTEPVKKADDDDKPKTPDFDITDPEAVKAHLQKARAATVDWDDPKDVENYLADLKKAQEEENEDLAEIDKAAGVTAEDDDEVKALKRQLFKAQKRSNRTPPKKDEPKGETAFENLTKAEEDEWKLGLEAAKAYNKESGFGDDE